MAYKQRVIVTLVLKIAVIDVIKDRISSQNLKYFKILFECPWSNEWQLYYKSSLESKVRHVLGYLQEIPYLMPIIPSTPILSRKDCNISFHFIEIGFVQSKLGISPGWGGGTRLVNIIGKRNALRLLSTATTLSQSAAMDVGLADGYLDTNKVIYSCSVIINYSGNILFDVLPFTDSLTNKELANSVFLSLF